MSRLHGGKDEFPGERVLRQQSPGQSSSKHDTEGEGGGGTSTTGNEEVGEVRGEIESDIQENKNKRVSERV